MCVHVFELVRTYVCICFRLLLRREGDVFCDIGSGTGRLVFAAAAM